jgi:DNA-binding MarR family transcriptional regulator
MIEARGGENRGYRRIQELSCLKTITSLDVCMKYAIGKRAANLWLNRIQRLGLIKRLPKTRTEAHNRYVITSEGKKVCATLDAIEREFSTISYGMGIDEPFKILETIKEKKLRLAKR